MKALLDAFVSIPSRGFWFFEGEQMTVSEFFGYMKFQSPRGDFGFLKERVWVTVTNAAGEEFQSPRGDFGFLKTAVTLRANALASLRFNPLAGILVF